MYETVETIGGPDIKLAGFSLWVVGRQFPDGDDYWNGNWLHTRSTVEASGAYVEVSDRWLHIDALRRFHDELVAVDRDLCGAAELCGMEPTLRLRMECGTLGHIDLSVEMSPDQLTQSHRFTFEVDQSYLPRLLAECRTVLGRFPILGEAR